MIATPPRSRKTPPRSTRSGAGLCAAVCSLLVGFDDLLSDFRVIDGANAAPSSSGVAGECGPDHLFVGGMDATLHVETARVAVTDGRVTDRAGERLGDGCHETAFASGQSVWPSAELAVFTGGLGFGRSGDGTELLCSFVFHYVPTLNRSLGYVNRKSAQIKIYSANSKDHLPPRSGG